MTETSFWKYAQLTHCDLLKTADILPESILICLLLIENFIFEIIVSWSKFHSRPIYDTFALVQVVPRRGIGGNMLPEPMITNFLYA